MPEAVLRNKGLPGQPLILDIPVGGYVDRSYQAAGWEIDTSTSADDARDELAKLAEKAAKKRAEAEAAFVPAFEPDPDASSKPAKPEQAPAVLDTTKEH